VKCIRELLRKLEALHKRGTKVEIRWECEEGDDDSLSVGEGFKSLENLPFDIVVL